MAMLRQLRLQGIHLLGRTRLDPQDVQGVLVHPHGSLPLVDLLAVCVGQQGTELDDPCELGRQVGIRLADIGCAFAAARVIELAKSGAYKEDKHAATLDEFPFSMWNSSERALAPALVIELSGADFKPSAIVPFLDANIKFVFNLDGDAPAAALSRVVSPTVFVQQETGNARR